METVRGAGGNPEGYHLVDSTCEPDSLPFEPAQTDLTFDRKELPQQFHKLTFPGWSYIHQIATVPDQN